MKLNHLVDKKAVDIMQAVQESHFEDTDMFTAEQGFNIAVAFIDYYSQS